MFDQTNKQNHTEIQPDIDSHHTHDVLNSSDWGRSNSMQQTCSISHCMRCWQHCCCHAHSLTAQNKGHGRDVSDISNYCDGQESMTHGNMRFFSWQMATARERERKGAPGKDTFYSLKKEKMAIALKRHTDEEK